MSRSGYSFDLDLAELNLYRHAVHRAIHGRRGQKLLRDLLVALDAMPQKRLIYRSLVDPNGEVCALGALGRYRGTDMEDVDCDDPEAVGQLFGCARSLAAEIEFENDEQCEDMSPEDRWTYMRAWVSSMIDRAK